MNWCRVALHVVEPDSASLHINKVSYRVGSAIVGSSIVGYELDDDINLSIGSVIYSTETQPYEGAYEADALFSQQVFLTKNKRMVENFTVNAINYTEAPNEYGTTVTIGG